MLKFLFGLITLFWTFSSCSYSVGEIKKKEWANAVIGLVLTNMFFGLSRLLFDWYKLAEFFVKVVE